jgi:uncharacterized protein YbjT (DUF2867 family)
MRVIVIGASGNYGARITRALQQTPGIEGVPARRSSAAGARLDISSPD